MIFGGSVIRSTRTARDEGGSGYNEDGCGGEWNTWFHGFGDKDWWTIVTGRTFRLGNDVTDSPLSNTEKNLGGNEPKSMIKDRLVVRLLGNLTTREDLDFLGAEGSRENGDFVDSSDHTPG